MKFIVTKSSSYGFEENPPCENAIIEDVLCIDKRVASVLENERDSKWVVDWFETGLNHRKVGRYWMRDIPEKVWTIEINSLEELIKLQEKEGPIIINGSNYDIPKEIEIYDSYRE